jgi:hypothetical protein
MPHGAITGGRFGDSCVHRRVAEPQHTVRQLRIDDRVHGRQIRAQDCIPPIDEHPHEQLFAFRILEVPRPHGGRNQRVRHRSQLACGPEAIV